MKIQSIDFPTIAKVIKSGPPNAALPSNLDDAILHQIARDLRLIEVSCTVDDGVKPPIAGPMFLITCLIQQQNENLNGSRGAQLPVDRLQHWLQRYMYYIEREIVSRAIKMPCPTDAEDLLLEIRVGISIVK
jgi:hypothetical protein